MTTIQPITISPIGARDRTNESKKMMTPTTPRPTYHLVPRPSAPRRKEEQTGTTPTRDSFAAANGKRTLPQASNPPEEQPDPVHDDDAELRRNGSQRSIKHDVMHDVEMAGSDEGEEGSDNESNEDDDAEQPSKKKKKGQRFFCTEYPPCNLSFTRSEHLARHIR